MQCSLLPHPTPNFPYTFFQIILKVFLVKIYNTYLSSPSKNQAYVLDFHVNSENSKN